MIRKVLYCGRAVGIILSIIPVFIVAVLTQVLRSSWSTATSVWKDSLAMTPEAKRQAINEETDRRKQQEAIDRREKHIRKGREKGTIVGAVREKFEELTGAGGEG